MKRKPPIFVMIGLIFFLFLYTERNLVLSNAQAERLDNKEAALVNDILLDLGELSDESVSPKTFFVDVPILTYHQVRPIAMRDNEKFRRFITSPEEFEQQMQFIKNQGYTVVSLLDIENHLATRTSFQGKTVALTFDDGYQSQYQYALPILRKYGYSGTFFIYTHAIDKIPAAMTWKEIWELDKDGMTIGAHTRTHVILTKITDEKKLDEEILGSKKDIEAHLQKPTQLFAYPYGQYDDKILTHISDAGYLGGVGVKMGRLQTYDLRFALKRYNINDNDAQFREVFKAEAR